MVFDPSEFYGSLHFDLFTPKITNVIFHKERVIWLYTSLQHREVFIFVVDAYIVINKSRKRNV